MTTITVEIDKDNDLSAVKEFIGALGLRYRMENNDGLIYSNELKEMLDQRYNSYLEGTVCPISAEESRDKIQALLSAKSK